MAKVTLYGQLAKQFGKTFELAVHSPAEAVRALMVNFKRFEETLKKGEYRVLVDETDLSESDLQGSVKPEQHIRIIPVVSGAKGGLFKIIAGVALIAAAMFVPGLQGLAAYAIGGLGGALVMGGMASMLTPTTNTGEQRQAKRIENKYFSSPENTEVQGEAVGLVYGRFRTGSNVISSGIVVE